MGRKRKKNIILEKIELNDAGSLGKAISKSENQKVIFTKFGVPGDIVDIQVKKKRKSYIEGCLLYTSPSPRDGLLSRMPSSA